LTTFTGSTVTYNGAVAQAIGDFTYRNLILSGSGVKSTANNTNTSVSGNLSIAPTGTASLSIYAGRNVNAGTLSLGGVGQVNGTWDSTSSAAIHTNNTYFAPTTGTVTVTTSTAGGTPQTISFTSSAPVSAVVGGPSYTPTATATSGLTVAFTIDGTASSICSINGSNVVAFTGAGSCVIDANQAGNATYSAAPQVQQTFTVGKGTQTTLAVTGPASLGYTGTAPITTSGGSGTGTISYSTSSASSQCTVNSTTGVITAHATSGNCVVAASKAADSNYNATSSANFNVTLTLGTPPFTLNPSSTTYCL